MLAPMVEIFDLCEMMVPSLKLRFVTVSPSRPVPQLFALLPQSRELSDRGSALAGQVNGRGLHFFEDRRLRIVAGEADEDSKDIDGTTKAAAKFCRQTIRERRRGKQDGGSKGGGKKRQHKARSRITTMVR